MAAYWKWWPGACLLVFLAAGCQEHASPCEDVQCGWCQKCVVGDGGLECVWDVERCEEPMHHPCLKIGVPCADSTECCDGWCLKYSDGSGYCAKRDCQNDDACVNYNNDGREMCCVDRGGEFKVCLKIDPGCGCGIQDQTCGGDCACQLDSACDPNHTCLTAGDIAYCSHECMTDNDCSDCSNLAVPEGTFSCVPTAAGVAYCTFLIPPCTSSSECAGGDECVPYLSPDGSALEGYCGHRGALKTGDECSEEDDQCAGLCLKANEVRGGRCSSVCAVDADCPTGMRCIWEAVCLREPCTDIDNLTSILMCKEDLRCASHRDCLADLEVCVVRLTDDGNGIEGLCHEPSGATPTGDPCTEVDIDDEPSYDSICAAEACIDGHCSEVCELDSDCPGGLCQPYELGLPSGSTASIPICRYWIPCVRPSDCPAGQGCRPYLMVDGSTLEGYCVSGGTLPTGASCDPDASPDAPPEELCESDFCLEPAAGAALCSEVCVETADCPAGMVCALQTFCLRDPCTEPGNQASIEVCVGAP